ncbi:hypothetical protein Sango_1698200 [Sesamum angolense]|uniref:Rubredoxin-like domain-containing protein n=1 Tax=Sesamum angolense TaxID=2727404 RepID=A0AAE1WLD1_9LAMI|nr:hypothetical protein Sango_1698200 [Sesamum angolense]
MALAPTSLHGAKSIAPPSPPGNAGLRLPARPFALRSSSFFSPSLQLLMPPHVSAAPATAPKFSMRVASKQAYICRDCGYIYNDRTPLRSCLTICGAPKRRFRPYAPAVSKDANNIDVRKARKEQIKKDEAIGQALPFAIALGAVALAGLYFYINSTS